MYVYQCLCSDIMYKQTYFALDFREHDKNPELFFQTLYQLMEEQVGFKVSVLGQTFSEVPGKC